MSEIEILEKYKKTIIKDTIKQIYEKYSIYDEENDITLDEKEIIEYLKKLNNPHKKRCCGVSKTGFPVQCKSFALENFDYCKKHMMTYGSCTFKPITRETEIDVEICKNKYDIDIDISNLKRKFIEDSFYYVDNFFIYNNLKQKVGYIHDNEYHLTDDPYILDG